MVQSPNKYSLKVNKTLVSVPPPLFALVKEILVRKIRANTNIPVKYYQNCGEKNKGNDKSML